LAREDIDAALEASGWTVQDVDEVNLDAGAGVAVREFPLKSGHGFADYLLFVGGSALGVVEAKPPGFTLTGVETQAQKYSEGLPDELTAAVRPLPYLYQSTGVETRFTNGLDPEPRSREIFGFHRPETLERHFTPGGVLRRRTTAEGVEVPANFDWCMRYQLPELPEGQLWPVQVRAVERLEESFAAARRRALIQMSTGSGKTYTAVTSIYRLIKHGGARRVLFVVDRRNLGRQALREFQQYVTPDDGRKFAELYNVQLLAGPRIDPAARVVIATVQRLYHLLGGGAEEIDDTEERPLCYAIADLRREPVEVEYNPGIPIETFDVIFTDECHRSIYNLWRQVLEYFDASLVGLTATPSKQTLGFFHQNLVMEYGHQEAVADGVNVDYNVYTIKTEISESGSTVEAETWLGLRDRRTREMQWAQLNDDYEYDSGKLDRVVVAPDQIRTVVRTFRDKLFTEIFPGRSEVPKTLVFAKTDSHADDIVQIMREEFGKGNDFCRKITYRTTGAKPETLLAEFRNSPLPRIVVTVDMLATGTDIKPLEVIMFMRSVKSRIFFDQMKGRGVRVIDDVDYRAVLPGGKTKTHFVIVDCVRVCEEQQTDSQPLERQPKVGLKKLLGSVSFGSRDPDVLSTVASRLTRLDRRFSERQREEFAAVAGMGVRDVAKRIVGALDPDRQVAAVREKFAVPDDEEPTEAQVTEAAGDLLYKAAEPLRRPEVREKLLRLNEVVEQVIDDVSQDAVIEVGYSAAARVRARGVVESFGEFIREHRDEITALQVLYSVPYRRRLRLADIKDLAKALSAPPWNLRGEALWRAYETLERDRVRGGGGALLTDIVALVRFALEHDEALVPYPEQVEARYDDWLSEQETAGKSFTSEQRRWLGDIRDCIAANLECTKDDFELDPFAQRGGLGRAHALFGDELGGLLDELNGALAA